MESDQSIGAGAVDNEAGASARPRGAMARRGDDVVHRHDDFHRDRRGDRTEGRLPQVAEPRRRP
eukprot:9512360-Alexandrium_andersonii.AAC.1